jgi:hypothetical protein
VALSIFFSTTFEMKAPEEDLKISAKMGYSTENPA